MSISATFAAGEEKEFYAPGDFFRLLDAAAAVTLRFYSNGKEVAVAESVDQGYAERFREGVFDRVRIYSATVQTVKFVVRLGNDVQYDKAPTGAVTLAGQQGAFTPAQKTVTTPSAQLLAANLLRRYLLIQNNDAGVDIWVNLGGGVAGANLNGSVKIAAGGSIELQGYVCSGQVNAFAASANANVAVVEG